MKKLTALGLLNLVFVVIFALAASPAYAGEEKSAGEGMAMKAVTVELNTLNDSGVSGTATLTPMDNQTKVVINLTGAPEGGVHPAHIHEGTCASLEKPAYPLNDITNGASETVVDAGIKDIISADHAINVHKSSEEMSAYVTCGTISKSDHMH